VQLRDDLAQTLVPDVHGPVVRASHHNLELRDLVHLEYVIGVLVAALTAYLPCWFILRVDLDDPVPAHGNDFRTLIVAVYAHYVSNLFEFLLSLFFFLLIIFREVM